MSGPGTWKRSFSVSCSEISASVLESWNLPTPVRDAVLSYDHPSPPEKGCWHLANIVQAADWLGTQSRLSQFTGAGAVSEAADEFHDPILHDRLTSLELTFENEFRAVTAVI